jgi:hypothetical protein
LYLPELINSGVDATEIKGSTTETPAVSTTERIIAIKNRITRRIFLLLFKSRLSFIGMDLMSEGIINID